VLANLVIKIQDKVEVKHKNKKTNEPKHSSKDLWYCWLHGIMHAKMTNSNLAHDSNTCKYPAKGHDKMATLYNMCGGNNYFCHIPNKKAVYKHETYNERKCKCKEKAEAKKKQDKGRWGEPKTITDNTANHINKPFTDRSHTIDDTLGPSTHSHHQLIVDTGCTRHFLSTTAPIKNKTSTTNGI